MDEFIDILNEQNEQTGKTSLKSEAHKKGLLHASVHCWIFDNNKNVIIQQRAATKETFPNFWDVSVAGHIAAGEVPAIAAIREIKEEIGISVTKNQLYFIGTSKNKIVHHPQFIDNELHYIYLCEINFNITSLKIQQEEVAAVKSIPIKNLKATVFAKNNNFVKHGKAYYQMVFTEIENFNKPKTL